jgi:hypothetical protein
MTHLLKFVLYSLDMGPFNSFRHLIFRSERLASGKEKNKPKKEKGEKGKGK